MFAWTSVFILVAAIGAAIAIWRPSRAWTLAGIGYGLGGLGLATYTVVLPDPPVGETALDVAGWFETIGLMSLLVGMVSTLIALGGAGRRKFLQVLAVVTLTVAVYQYWTTNWPARFGDVASHCTNKGLDFRAGPIRRIPPGLTCHDGGKEVFVAADGLSWVALAGWSLFYGFVFTFPVTGAAWLISRRPLTPARISP